MIIDHGAWDYYTPAKPRYDAPTNTMYLRRDDGKDWYDYQQERPFKDGSVIMVAHPQADGSYVIGPATYDYTAIFPAQGRLLEETAYSGTDPQTDLGQRTYNLDQRKVGMKYTPPPLPLDERLMQIIDRLTKRVEVLEKQQRGK
jgi:hypothetical protein